MLSSATDSNYTRSNCSPNRSETPTSISTIATSRSGTPQSFSTTLNKKNSTNSREPRYKLQPRHWQKLLEVPSDHSRTSSQQARLYIAQSPTNSTAEVNRQEHQKEGPPSAMGGKRTSLSMNGGPEAHRRMSSYDEQYRYKDNVYGSARERVHRESPVIAELRTNVIVSVTMR